MYIYRPTYMTGEPIAQGDWVKVFSMKSRVWHHGIVRRIRAVADGFVVHIAHNFKASGVTLSRLRVFADGNEVRLLQHPSSKIHAREIITRVDASMDMPYSLIAQNCEHFASFAFTGKAESKSLQVVGGIAVAMTLASLLFGE